MAELFQIMKVTVGADKLRARVMVNPGMPCRTSEDIEATARVYYLAPGIATHLCLGDTGSQFQDCMSDTEVAHLLEHLTVEVMRQTGLAGEVACGRTRAVPEDGRLFDIELSCPDDALTVGSLSSAAFMMDWAFLHPESPAPDFPGTVAALRQLMLNLRGEAPQDADDDNKVESQESAAAAGDADGRAADVAQDGHAVPGADRIETEAVHRAPAGQAPVKHLSDASSPVFGGAAAEARV